MSTKISQSEIDYNRRLSEEDRQREILRQKAYRDVRAQAHLFRVLSTEPSHSYKNAEGYRVTCDSLPLSLF
ncbi:hypothetical protein [Pantoea sp. UBA5037]|uniref:hypothetical protein n=1 Tax=Pantoea sp. UBA5037 TaxID=1947036 RepID=UPI00257CB8D1|nr:hypothetical protein [Pantoea sp. UBA5037]MDU4747639.1 hypothetical protein [Pantoea sp.]